MNKKSKTKVKLGFVLFCLMLMTQAAWGETAELQLSANNKFTAGGTLTDSDDFIWSETGARVEGFLPAWNGQLFTSTNATTYTFSADFTGYNISKVTIKACATQENEAKYSVKINGINQGNGTVVCSESAPIPDNAIHVINCNGTGIITITIQKGREINFYLNSIEVEYTENPLYAQQKAVLNGFTSIEGNIDSNISYKGVKGGKTNLPSVNDNILTLSYPASSSAKGHGLEISAKQGFEITRVDLVTASKSNVTMNYTLGDSESYAGENIIIKQGSTYNICNLNCSKITIYRATNDKIDLELSGLKVFYRQVSTGLTISAAGYATFYDSCHRMVVPEGVTAYTAYWDTASRSLHMVAAYESGSVIPENEPVILNGSGDITLELTQRESRSSMKAINKNDLEGTDAETDLANDDTKYYYALSLNANQDLESVGFYWMNDDGSAFTNGAHKAYLVLSKSEFQNAAKSAFRFEESPITTGMIDAQAIEKSNNIAYDLLGRRVSDSYRGLVIINGKKVIR